MSPSHVDAGPVRRGVERPVARRSPARRESMRALQHRLLERLRVAPSQPRSPAWVAVEAAGAGYLLPLAEAGEIFTEASVMPLPHTQPWFQGVAVLRGQLFGVVDLAAFLGGSRRPGRLAGPPPRGSRLVSLNPALGARCVLRVDRLVGLREAAQLGEEVAPWGVPPSFAQRCWQDGGGRRWIEIDLGALAANEAFLGIAS